VTYFSITLTVILGVLVVKYLGMDGVVAIGRDLSARRAEDVNLDVIWRGGGSRRGGRLRRFILSEEMRDRGWIVLAG